MYPTHHFKDKFILFLKIFFPILVYQFANYSASFVDTTMTGQYNTIDLAGVSMATSLWNPFFTFLTGIVSALVPIVGHHLGRGKKEEVASDFYQFLYLSLGLSIFLFVLVFLVAPLVLNNMGLEAAVANIAVRYLWFLAIGIIPLLLFSVIRSLLDALGLTRLSMYLMLLLLPLNSGFNYLLIYGVGAFPRLGVSGAAFATLIARGFELVALIIYIVSDKTHPFHATFKELFVKDFGLYNRVVKTGLPVVFSESGWSIGLTLVFATYGIIGPSALAVIQVASLTSMIFQSVIFGFGNGASVAIGETLGIGKFELAKLYANKTIKIALVMIACMVAGIILMIKPISAIYNFSPETTELLGKVLVVFAFTLIPRMLSYIFQCGILRAGGDTLFCMVIELTSNLVIELAMAYTAVVFLKWPLQMCIALASLGNIFKMSAFIIRYKSGKWQKKVI